MGQDFDFQNFGIGFAAGVATSYGVYRLRRYLSAARSAVGEQAGAAQAYANQNPDRRYSNELVKTAQTTHLLGHRVSLTDILVEPRFIRGQELAEIPEEDEVERSAFTAIPRVHDYPFLHAPYNVETLSIEDLGHGDNTLALLGQPGSGRTTALFTIALWSLGHVDFKSPFDAIQEQLDREEEQLSREERADRIKDRFAMAERALEQLAEERGETYRINEDANVPLLKRIAPLYVHLANVSLARREYGRTIDPAEPFVRALQYQSGLVASKTTPRNAYKRLNQGRALVLIDGLDDLPLTEQKRKQAWLAAFIEQYSNNTVIVAGPAAGYGNLLNMGLAPVFLRPWSDNHIHTFADKCAEQWSTISDSRHDNVDTDMVEFLKFDSGLLHPVEITLRFQSQLGNSIGEGEHPIAFENQLQDYLRSQFPETQSVMPELARMAALQLDSGFITESQLVELATHSETSSAATTALPEESTTPEVESTFNFEELVGDFTEEGFDDVDDVDEEAETAAPKDETKEAKQIRSEQVRLLKKLLKVGLLVGYKGNRYQFRHPFIAAYLASYTLTEDTLAEKAENPAWNQAIAYAALHMPIDSAVQKTSHNAIRCVAPKHPRRISVAHLCWTGSKLARTIFTISWEFICRAQSVPNCA